MLTRIFRFFIIFATLFSSSVYADSLEEMVSNLIIERLGGDASEIELNFDNKSKSLLPNLKNQGIKSVRLTYYEPNYSSFRVSVTAKSDQMYDLFGRYKAYLNVPTMARGVAVGTIITEADIVLLKTLYSRVKSGYLTSLGDILGMQARRRLAGGAFIRKNDVVKPQIVRQGDNVSLIYDQGNIKLRTTGIAQGNGGVGDNIKIKNETTGTIVHGVIKGKNLVEVGG